LPNLHFLVPFVTTLTLPYTVSRRAGVLLFTRIVPRVVARVVARERNICRKLWGKQKSVPLHIFGCVTCAANVGFPRLAGRKIPLTEESRNFAPFFIGF
jgi:hypothetical protein